MPIDSFSYTSLLYVVDPKDLGFTKFTTIYMCDFRSNFDSNLNQY